MNGLAPGLSQEHVAAWASAVQAKKMIATMMQAQRAPATHPQILVLVVTLILPLQPIAIYWLW